MKLGETCDNCGLKCTKDLKTAPGQYADPCMGILPGVKYSCCGHGEDDGYIFFENGIVIRFSPGLDVEKKMVSRYHSFNDETTIPKR